ncbi:MAG: hypothetical protein EOO27_50555, partial [Comamonadaceae bacterium]
MQGLSAAIVLTAIEKITDMIKDAESKLESKVEPAIQNAIRGIPAQPESVKAAYGDSAGKARSALSSATITAATPTFSDVPTLVDSAVMSFYEDYTGAMEQLFPGLLAAGEQADRFIQSALQSAIGVSYSEQVDRTGADTVFALARKAAFQQERETFDVAGAAGHRFAPGTALNAITRIHAESTQQAADAIAAAHASRLDQERSDKMRLVRAEIGQRMDRIKKIQSQVADAFRMKMRASGMWVNDQNAVIDAWNNTHVMPVQFQARMADMLREVTARRHASVVGAYEVSDRAVDIGRLRLGNGQEIVDMLGNMIATLQNQIRASGSYSGTERDIT